jgi:ferrous iron transport protein A
MIPLSTMKKGTTGTIIKIQGGHAMQDKLSNLGIREGRTVKKISQHALKGPAVLEVDRTQVALGFGMASKIFVDAENKT